MILSCRATSATSHVVLGQFKTCVILIGGFLVFRANPGPKSVCGASMALSGMAMYTFLNLKQELNNEITGKPVLHKQASLSTFRPHVKGSKLFVENLDAKEASECV